MGEKKVADLAFEASEKLVVRALSAEEYHAAEVSRVARELNERHLAEIEQMVKAAIDAKTVAEAAASVVKSEAASRVKVAAQAQLASETAARRVKVEATAAVCLLERALQARRARRRGRQEWTSRLTAEGSLV